VTHSHPDPARAKAAGRNEFHSLGEVLPSGAPSGASRTRLASLDRLGAVVSFACALHCLAVPLIIGVLPFLGLGFIGEERTDTAIAAIAVTIAAASALWGFHRHRELRLLMAFAAAIGLVAVGNALGLHDALGRWLAIAGGLAIAVSHVISSRLCHRCPGPATQ